MPSKLISTSTVSVDVCELNENASWFGDVIEVVDQPVVAPEMSAY